MRQLNLITLVTSVQGQHLMMNPREMLKRINHDHQNPPELDLDNPAYSLLLKYWSDRCCHVPGSMFHPVLLATCFDQTSLIEECGKLERQGLSHLKWPILPIM